MDSELSHLVLVEERVICSCFDKTTYVYSKYAADNQVPGYTPALFKAKSFRTVDCVTAAYLISISKTSNNRFYYVQITTSYPHMFTATHFLVYVFHAYDV